MMILFVLLGTGAGVIMVASSFLRTYRTGYLRSYLYYLILFYVYGLYGLLGTIIARYLLHMMQTPQPVMETIGFYIPFLGIPFQMTAWYMFFKFCRELTGKKPSPYFTLGYFLFQVIFFLVYGFIVFRLSKQQSELYRNVTELIGISFAVIESVTVLLALAQVYYFNARMKGSLRRKMMLNFTHINLAVFAAVIVFSLLSDKNTIMMAIYLFVYFTCNIPPLLYLGTFLSKTVGVTPSVTAKMDIDINDMVTRYGISKRETEVIELLAEGKTNREISGELFITLQTVKDHIHHIFQKTGVRNRVELMNLMSESRLMKHSGVTDKSSLHQ
jgi:DNA-binding CsgD family transcriptional regulator